MPIYNKALAKAASTLAISFAIAAFVPAAAQMKTKDITNTKPTKTKTEAQIRTVVQSSNEVDMTLALPEELDPGFIGGLSDIDGIQETIVTVTREAVKEGKYPNQEILDRLAALGVDFDAIRGMAELDLSTPFEIERVEFIPGFDLGSDANGIITDFANPGDGGGGDLSPGLPNKSSLVGQLTYARTGGDGNGNSWHYWEFSDGSSSHRQRTGSADGKVKLDILVVTDANGEIEYSHTTTSDSSGGFTGELRTPEENENGRSEAYEAERDAQQEREQSNEGSDDSSGDADPAIDGGSIDQFQPAEGDGNFCPLAIEICRRQMEQALAGGEDVLTGMVLVNPADPDVQPTAPRMMINTNDLLMDPMGRNRAGKLPDDGRITQVVLPVLVNPPSPEE